MPKTKMTPEANSVCLYCGRLDRPELQRRISQQRKELKALHFLREDSARLRLDNAELRSRLARAQKVLERVSFSSDPMDHVKAGAEALAALKGEGNA